MSPGGAVTFTATVTGTGGVTPTGPVTWTVIAPGGASVPCDSSSGPTGSSDVATYTCTLANAWPGSYTATAAYPGDSNYAAASGTDDSADVMPVTLIQGPPTVETVLKGAGYSTQLFVTNAIGAVTFTEGGSAASVVVRVGPAGTIHVDSTTPAGTYTVGGTDSDSVGDTGTWTFTLTIAEGCGVATQSIGNAPPVGTNWALGETMRTGKNGGVTFLRKIGRTTFGMSENTQITCDRDLANDSGGTTTIFTLLQGLFQYTSGLIGKSHDQEQIDTPVGCICIRGSVFAAEVLPGRRLLVHVSEGTGFVRIRGKLVFTFPPGEGVLFNLNRTNLNGKFAHRRRPVASPHQANLEPPQHLVCGAGSRGWRRHNARLHHGLTKASQGLALPVPESGRCPPMGDEAINLVIPKRSSAHRVRAPGHEPPRRLYEMIDALGAVPLRVHLGDDRVDTSAMRPIFQAGPKA